jgi:nitrite reductase/ring-hydroxylating ferredoxin subunit
VKVYDQTYVLWRPRPDEVAAIPDACPHRGASLAMGSLVGTVKEGKCIKCPYHGLEYNAAGSCNKPNIFTDSINVVEANGLVWMKDAPLTPTDLLESGADEVDLAPFLRGFHEALGAPIPEQNFLDAYSGQESEGGSDEAGDVPPFNEHFGMGGFRSMGGFVDIAAAPKAVVDNTFDLHHMTHVHKTTFGGGELIRTWQPDDVTICFEYGMSRTNPFTSFFGDGRVLVKMERSPPYSAMVTVGDSRGRTVMKTLTHIVPVSENSSRLIWQLLRNFGTLPIMDPVFKYSVERILSEDQAVLEGVNLSGVREGMDLGI